VNKLSKTQRDQLLGIIIGAVALMAALWYLGVRTKQAELTRTEKKTAQMLDTLTQAEKVMRRGQEIADKLKAHATVLEKRESLLAPDRDAYYWIISTMNPFIASRKGVHLNKASQPDVSESGIIPNFPYKWATFHMEVTGFYHDVGKFLADLENGFPSFRVQNLTVSVNNGVGVEPESLMFAFDLVVPVKPSETK
jgi:Tfp pilus assembly protein PilO